MSNQAPPDEDSTVDEHGREFIARTHGFPANGTGFLITPVLWFAYFMIIYALQGAACVGGMIGPETLRLTLALLSLAVAGAIAALGVWSYRSWRQLLEELEEEEQQRPGHSSFLAYGALLHAGLFLVATLWIALPSLFMDPCRSPTQVGA